MPIEGNEWTKATRRSNGSGGMHVYIDQFNLECALRDAQIPLSAELEVKRYSMKDRKGEAKILLKIREVKT